VQEVLHERSRKFFKPTISVAKKKPKTFVFQKSIQLSLLLCILTDYTYCCQGSLAATVKCVLFDITIVFNFQYKISLLNTPNTVPHTADTIKH